MLINTSTETAAANLQRQRAESGTTTSQPSTAAVSSDASQLDPSLQRLTEVPSGIQDADWEIQDKEGAGQSVALARQSMLKQPSMVMATQANQLYQNVLNLLQPAD
jgi:hypothetical protein